MLALKKDLIAQLSGDPRWEAFKEHLDKMLAERIDILKQNVLIGEKEVSKSNVLIGEIRLIEELITIPERFRSNYG